MVLAVLQQHCGIRLHAHDVFASTVGGARLTEPASDLAVAVAIASATFVTPPPVGVVAMGEIGLAGELRRVRDLPQRLAEAARLGFKMAVVPAAAAGREEPTGPRSTRSDRVVDGHAGGRGARRALRAAPAPSRLPQPSTPSEAVEDELRSLGQADAATAGPATLRPSTAGGCPP